TAVQHSLHHPVVTRGVRPARPGRWRLYPVAGQITLETRTMLLASWFHRLKFRPEGSRAGRGRRRTPPQKRPARSSLCGHRLDFLEDRSVPSTLTVLNNFDSGAGSLRDAIAAAHNGDTVVFASSLAGQTITLTSGELIVNKSLELDGLGAANLTVSGNGTSRVFDIVKPGANVAIAGLTISQGFAVQGGGIDNLGKLI